MASEMESEPMPTNVDCIVYIRLLIITCYSIVRDCKGVANVRRIPVHYSMRIAPNKLRNNEITF